MFNQFFYKTAPIISLNTTNQLISTDKSLMFVQNGSCGLVSKGVFF